MARRTSAYVDTSAFIAFLDRSDSHHSLFRRLFAEPPPLVTKTWVVAEGHGWFLRRYDRNRALQFLALLESMPFLRTLSVGLDEQRSATSYLREFGDQDLTLADALGLATMKRRRIQACWSTDRHLGLTGVRLAIHG